MIERVHVVDPGDPLDSDDTFVHCLVRQTRRADEVADRVDAGFAGAQPFVDDDVGFLYGDAGVFEPDAFDIADDADREDDALDGELTPLPSSVVERPNRNGRNRWQKNGRGDILG
jgi:hypothetical protein